MNITFKLYASLTQYLPADAERNIATIDIADSASVHDILEQYRVPREAAHLILVNGFYIEPEERDSAIFKENDVLAIWPPVAGG